MRALMNTSILDRGAKPDFEMVRLSHSKEICDVSPNCIRGYGKRGLRIYKVGKSAYFSKSELEQFIRSRAA